MTNFGFIYFVGIVLSNQITTVFASAKYEHISTWKQGNDDCEACKHVNFTCGENNKDQQALSYVWTKRYFGRINFLNCKFREINGSFITTFADIHTLNIPDVELEKLEKTILWKATKLETMIARDNQLKEIPALLFIHAAQLSYVDFSNNSIKLIDPLAFENVISLQTLNVSYNQLDHIDESCLALPCLLTLDLSRNVLSSLQKGLFDKLIKLKLLNLSLNPIGHLDVETFFNLANLEHLYLRRMNISSIELGTFAQQHKMVSLDLSDNRLMKFDFNLFLPIVHDLQSLYLGQNLLTNLNGFRNSLMPQLALLDIKNNAFNCSYLRHFIEGVNWEKLHLPVDPFATQSQKPHIRGVNCEPTGETYKPDGQMGVNPNFPNQAKVERSSQSEQFIKVMLLLIFIVNLSFLVTFLLVNKSRLFRPEHHHDEEGGGDHSSNPFVVKYSNRGGNH